jgi:hypothetical protein
MQAREKVIQDWKRMCIVSINANLFKELIEFNNKSETLLSKVMEQ